MTTKKTLRDLNVIFIGPCRDAKAEERSEATARQWGSNPVTCWNTGSSEIATARCSLGAIVATGMPPDTDVVVMLDDDVRPTPVDLIGIIGRAACDPTQPLVVCSYAIRLPPGKDGQDERIAHYVDPVGRVYGGLGCVAMTASRFRFIHLEGAQPLVRVHQHAPLSSAPYRVGLFDGVWLSEDLYFFRTVHMLRIPTVLYPTCAVHGNTRVSRRFKMLDGAPLLSSLVVDEA